MDVGVVEAGQGQPALQIDHLGVLSRQFLYFRIAAYRNEFTVTDGYGLGPGLSSVNSEYFAVVQDHVGHQSLLSCT